MNHFCQFLWIALGRLKGHFLKFNVVQQSWQKESCFIIPLSNYAKCTVETDVFQLKKSGNGVRVYFFFFSIISFLGNATDD